LISIRLDVFKKFDLEDIFIIVYIIIMSNLLQKLTMSRKTILEMLNDRNVNTSKYDNFSSDELDIMYAANKKVTHEINEIDMVFPDEKVIVKYTLTSKIRRKDIEGLVNNMINENQLSEGYTLLIIVRETLRTETEIDTFFETIYEKNNIFIQLFDINKLSFNVTKHELVPKHTIISDEQKNNIMKKYQLSDELKFPAIKKNDPVAKYLGMKPGQVCEITRPSETYGIYTNYRLCVL